jgi:uncharacterized glyoxalase superfamily protein PhnB
MSNEIEYYPMPSFPALATANLITTSRWYKEVLGFQIVFEMPGPDGKPVLIHLRWAKYADLLLVADRNQTSEPKGVGVSLNFAMTQDSVDDLAARIVNRGGTIASGPVDQPWNAREITVLDPDGYRLVFTQPIDIRKSMEEVVDNVKHSTD